MLHTAGEVGASAIDDLRQPVNLQRLTTAERGPPILTARLLTTVANSWIVSEVVIVFVVAIEIAGLAGW